MQLKYSFQEFKTLFRFGSSLKKQENIEYG